MRFKGSIAAAALSVVVPMFIAGSPARALEERTIKTAIDEAIRPMMQEFNIPGMAVGFVIQGHPYVFNYGLASRESLKPVSGDTLFEIGSVSKTFTATLASYARVKGLLAWSDKVSLYVPSLLGSSFDKVSLLNLGTHTPGGMPLQVPDGIADNAQLMAYFKTWTPIYVPGTYRTYANPSIGLLGMIAADSLKENFGSLLERQMFPALGMTSSYLHIPDAEMHRYAQGYTKNDIPTRMSPGVLASEAYGIRTTAADMVRFIEANVRMIDLDATWQRAIDDTHTGYFKVGDMTQDLIWEQYSYPAELKTVLAGNSAKIAYEANPVSEIAPPLAPQDSVLINKTGSTNGFGAYVAFIPAKRMGIVILANKNYPIDARIAAAYRIFMRLDGGLGSKD